MASRYKRLSVPTLAGSPISVVFDREWEEYQVRVAGRRQATYHTSDKADALATAQLMRNTYAGALAAVEALPA